MINSISADDDRPFLYISDADYGRVQIYNWTSASFVGEINDKRLDGGLSAIKYCHSGLIFEMAHS